MSYEIVVSATGIPVALVLLTVGRLLARNRQKLAVLPRRRLAQRHDVEISRQLLGRTELNLGMLLTLSVLVALEALGTAILVLLALVVVHVCRRLRNPIGSSTVCRRIEFIEGNADAKQIFFMTFCGCHGATFVSTSLSEHSCISQVLLRLLLSLVVVQLWSRLSMGRNGLA